MGSQFMLRFTLRVNTCTNEEGFATYFNHFLFNFRQDLNSVDWKQNL